ncbi:MAG: protein-disulfide reductase DsbD [Burkholderiaceae bacterium]|nr:protein-disulfide reductase DsbD [Burkholderiaceae bacterium]
MNLLRLWAALGGLLWLFAAPQGWAEDDFLPPDQAFRYTTSSDGREIVVRWTVQPGYYLYLKRMGLESGDAGVTVGTPVYPKGELHNDEFFGEQIVFRGDFEVRAPVTLPAGTSRFNLDLKLQGCADAGLCYPPTTWQTSVDVGGAGALLDTARSGALFGGGTQSGDDFLPVDAAFVLETVADGPDRVRLRWTIADGYYLYRERMTATTTSEQARLGALSLPTGKLKNDEFFGEQEVYYDELVATLPVSRAGTSEFQLPLKVTFQGCAEAGLCYPPETKTLNVVLPAGAGTTASAGAPPGASGGFVSEQDRLAALIRDGSLWLVLATFFGLGLLLALTPCVLPMVPILSGIIAGQGENVTTQRAFALSLTYVLGMAVTNTLAGVAAAAAGSQIQAMFQQTWVIVLFALMFVVLALSMFGLFTIQMPSALQTRLTDVSNQQRAGTFGGVAMMGALSALIVTACVAPPLFAALAVIGQTGDLVRGGSALFFMSLGMGAPLILIGTSAGKLLPRAGAWMDTVKQLFGVLMLAVSAWMLARIVPDWAQLLLWAIPALIGAWILLRQVRSRSAWGWSGRAAGAALGIYGVVLLAGAGLGGTDPLKPIPQLAGEQRKLEFKLIKTVDDLEREVADAAAVNRPVMLDFYADWCVSCKEMEKYTFTDAAVQAALANAVLLKADVTANDAADQALLKHFEIFGPPTIAFYGPDGAERANYRVVGFMKAPEFERIAREAIAARTVTASN